MNHSTFRFHNDHTSSLPTTSHPTESARVQNISTHSSPSFDNPVRIRMTDLQPFRQHEQQMEDDRIQPVLANPSTEANSNKTNLDPDGSHGHATNSDLSAETPPGKWQKSRCDTPLPRNHVESRKEQKDRSFCGSQCVVL